ncbi:Hypothetical_protein [Hexamita inflata]|uniref:Hypothetical_protein n=1 Tax=Hexamita inflata TaxID=28002 RepID=A0AA86NX98_9EUKA|nr:Hypothetical protein HINF_LOCUS14678 [Hexamita inflata]
MTSQKNQIQMELNVQILNSTVFPEYTQYMVVNELKENLILNVYPYSESVELYLQNYARLSSLYIIKQLFFSRSRNSEFLYQLFAPSMQVPIQYLSPGKLWVSCVKLSYALQKIQALNLSHGQLSLQNLRIQHNEFKLFCPFNSLISHQLQSQQQNQELEQEQSLKQSSQSFNYDLNMADSISYVDLFLLLSQNASAEIELNKIIANSSLLKMHFQRLLVAVLIERKNVVEFVNAEWGTFRNALEMKGELVFD